MVYTLRNPKDPEGNVLLFRDRDEYARAAKVLHGWDIDARVPPLHDYDDELSDTFVDFEFDARANAEFLEKITREYISA